MSLLVVGSLNMDLVVRCSRVPRAGETLPGDRLDTLPGGKGANQAVAAARAGAVVRMVGCVGEDEFGVTLRESLAAAGVDVSGVRAVQGVGTGTATILVDAHGENRIVIVSGANAQVEASQFARSLDAATRVLFQMELPTAVTGACLQRAKEARRSVTLNAAPALGRLPGDWWPCIDHLVVNQVEAETLLDRSLEDERAEWSALAELRERGPATVTLTLGARGCLQHGEERWIAAAPRVDVIDTTAAGDAFVGVYEAAVDEGLEVPEALARAIAAGSLSTTQRGAQPSLPSREQILEAARRSRVRRA